MITDGIDRGELVTLVLVPKIYYMLESRNQMIK